LLIGLVVGLQFISPDRNTERCTLERTFERERGSIPVRLVQRLVDGVRCFVGGFGADLDGFDRRHSGFARFLRVFFVLVDQ
jgi:hypothetical protein